MYHLIWWWCCCCWTRAPRIALLYYCRGNGNDGPVYAPGGLFTSPRLNRCAFENGLIPIRAQLISKRCFHPQNVIKLHGNTNRNVAGWYLGMADHQDWFSVLLGFACKGAILHQDLLCCTVRRSSSSIRFDKRMNGVSVDCF